MSEIQSHQFSDSEGNPAGGMSQALGVIVSWQNGPLVYGRDGTKHSNGAFVEDLIKIAIDRLKFYENSKFSCKENKEAIHHLNEALDWLNSRTKDRERRGVEGTYQI
jgi:hypothetical protein